MLYFFKTITPEVHLSPSFDQKSNTGPVYSSGFNLLSVIYTDSILDLLAKSFEYYGKRKLLQLKCLKKRKALHTLKQFLLNYF